MIKTTKEIIEKYYESPREERVNLASSLEDLIKPVLYVQDIFSLIHGKDWRPQGKRPIPLSITPEEWISKKINSPGNTAHEWLLAHSKQWLEVNGFDEVWEWRKRYLGF